ncbi:MAG TPA: primosomal protein N', partial [Symbiobacteriaceae bacterium]|nr:primosomal protein N' [Symbiobacteriaceae bacterium]
KPGRVLVQTYQPEHYSLLAAREHDYQRFYDEEIGFRKMQHYPPYSELVRMVISGDEEQRVAETAAAIAELIQARKFSGEVLGPAPAPLARLRGQFRHHLVLKGADLARMGRELRAAFAAAGGKWRKSKDVKLSVDVGPVNIL